MFKSIKVKDSYNYPLATYVWQPDDLNSVKGVVQIIHGASEHAKRYDHYAKFLNTQGYIVVSHDHRGHGLTAEHYNYVYFSDTDGHEKVIDGVISIRKYIEKEFPNLPVFIVGHSMGSFITRYTIALHSDKYSGSIIIGTGYISAISAHFALYLSQIIILFKGKKHISKLMNHLTFDNLRNKLIKKGIIKEGVEWLSTDKDIQKQFTDDKTCGHKFSIGAQNDMFRWLVKISNKKFISKTDKNFPILLISGKDDPLGEYGKSIKKTYQLYSSLNYKNITYKLFNGRHEILNETNKDEVYKYTIDWLDSKN